MKDVLTTSPASTDVTIVNDLGSTGGLCYYLFQGHRNMACATSLPFDRSNILRYRLQDATERVNCQNWPVILELFLEESEKHFKPHTGLAKWPTDVIKTQSPQVDENTVKLFIENLIAPDDKTNLKRLALNEKYAKEKLNYLHYFNDDISESSLDKIFKSLVDKIVLLPYSQVAIEFTRDKSIFFEFRLRNLTLHFKTILSDSEPKGFFALYKNSDCVDNGVGPINDVLNRLLDIKKNAELSPSSTT